MDARARAFVPPTAKLAVASEMVIVRGATFHFGAEAVWAGPTPGSSSFGPTPDGVVMTVATFAIDRTEVTVRAYRACVQSGACPAQPDGTTVDDCTYNRADFDAHPINCVGFDDAKAFCAWSGKRLPTEAEFELAERGVNARPFPWGEAPPTPKHLNACDESCVREGAKRGSTFSSLWASTGGDDGWPFTAPVGSYPDGASPYGVLDLAGNVEEWTSDPWNSVGATAPLTTTPGYEDYVVRGGSWDLGTIDMFCGTRRSAAASTTRTSWLGFRCARDAS